MKIFFLCFSLVYFGCGDNSLDNPMQVSGVLERRFNFKFPNSYQVIYAKLYFNERSSAYSVYMKLMMSKKDFSTFVDSLQNKLVILGDANWGDQKVKSDLRWWDAHLLDHDKMFAIKDAEGSQMKKSGLYFSKRINKSGLIEIYLSSQWFVN